MISDIDLLFLNSQGFIPGPLETEENFLKRIAAVKAAFHEKSEIPRHHWEWVRAHVRNIFDFEPHSLPAFYSNKGLTLWQGAAVWIEKGTILSVQLKEAFKKGTYLGYSREEILAHESVHAARSAFFEPKSEEFFAFFVSQKWWRRIFGPIVRHSWEVWVFLVFAIGGCFSFFGGAAVALWILLGCARLLGCHWKMRQAARNLQKIICDVRKVRAILLRLTDGEIALFAKGEDAIAFANRQTCLRWRLIRLAYL